MGSLCLHVQRQRRRVRPYLALQCGNLSVVSCFGNQLVSSVLLPDLAAILSSPISLGCGLSTSYAFTLFACTLVPLQGFWNSVVFFRVRAKKKLSEAASNVLSNNFSRNIFSRFSSQEKENNLHSAVSGNVGSECLDTPRSPGFNTSESQGASNENNNALHIPNGQIDDNASEDASIKKNDKRIS